MDNLLAIETSTALGSIAIGRQGALVAEVVLGVATKHAESALPAIDRALRAAGMDVTDIDGVVIGGGPGSFTGVRIAAGTAKGLVHALGMPLYAYSGLAALAASLGAESRPVCAAFDARRGEVYAGCYRFPAFSRIEVLMPPGPRRLEAVLAELVDVAPIYAGDGAIRYQQQIEAQGGLVAPTLFTAPRAGALLWLASLDPDAGRVEQPEEWEPAYLRSAGAQRGIKG